MCYDYNFEKLVAFIPNFEIMIKVATDRVSKNQVMQTISKAKRIRKMTILTPKQLGSFHTRNKQGGTNTILQEERDTG